MKDKSIRNKLHWFIETIDDELEGLTKDLMEMNELLLEEIDEDADESVIEEQLRIRDLSSQFTGAIKELMDLKIGFMNEFGCRSEKLN